MPPELGARLWIALAASVWLATGAAAELPPEGRCPAAGAVPGAGEAEDAIPVRLREGMLLDWGDLPSLRMLIPPEVWRNREAFFHEGMQLTIGPCHRRYPVPSFFSRATEEFAGSARVDEKGSLHGYVAGLPFPPEAISAEAPDAGIRWAWNLEHRYRGSGPIGRFRLVDMPSRVGAVQTYLGSAFFIQTRHRADLPGSEHAVPGADESLWIAGGRFDEPFSARHLAWRQLRPPEVHTRFSEPDDTFVYVPTMRKVRRAATVWVDGIYTPSYRVSGDAGGGSIPVGGGHPYAPGGSIQPTAGESIAVTENLRRGFTGLAIRPNAYVWRVLGEREVLAPINGSQPGYPIVQNRNFGPSGLSVGNDRWDVRWAVVLQGAVRERGRAFDLLTLYVDYQTQQPLYVVTKRRNGRLVDVGILVHRFSGDVWTYPPWPTGEKALVFDPVGAVFYDAADGGSGWRREAYGVVSVPPSEHELRRYLSPHFLTRGH